MKYVRSRNNIKHVLVCVHTDKYQGLDTNRITAITFPIYMYHVHFMFTAKLLVCFILEPLDTKPY